MSCILDTNIVIFILRGNEKLKMELEQAIFEGRDICISAITYYETKRKILLFTKPDKQMHLFEEFLKDITLLPFSQPTADIASGIYASLSSTGKKISPCDVLIGATAIEKDLPIVAEDKHFAHIEDLKCGLKREKWVIT